MTTQNLRFSYAKLIFQYYNAGSAQFRIGGFEMNALRAKKNGHSHEFILSWGIECPGSPHSAMLSFAVFLVPRAAAGCRGQLMVALWPLRCPRRGDTVISALGV
jgi:hypothetical protein